MDDITRLGEKSFPVTDSVPLYQKVQSNSYRLTVSGNDMAWAAWHGLHEPGFVGEGGDQAMISDNATSPSKKEEEVGKKEKRCEGMISIGKRREKLLEIEGNVNGGCSGDFLAVGRADSA